MWVRREAWDRVTESEELVGRLRVASRLPQYLVGWWGGVNFVCFRLLEGGLRDGGVGSNISTDLLDDCYVHRSCGTGPVYGFLRLVIHLVIHLECPVHPLKWLSNSFFAGERDTDDFLC